MTRRATAWNVADSRRLCVGWVVVVIAGLAVGVALAEPPGRSFCNVSDETSGYHMPPLGCSFIATSGVFQIVDGLPPGSTIEADPVFFGFECVSAECVVDDEWPDRYAWFTGTLQFYMSGTGDLAGFSRIVEVPVEAWIKVPAEYFELDWGISYSASFYDLSGSLVGDPDFASLHVTGGTTRGFASPGQVTQLNRPGGAASIDSYFDLGYQIDFVGAPGGALDGLSGSTQGNVRLEVERPPLPVGVCEGVDVGTGTADLPPADCTYLNPEESMQIIDGLPPGTTIEIGFAQSGYVCDFIPCGQPGGDLGGDAESFDSQIHLELRGTGSLDGYWRTLTLTGDQVNHSAPRMPGDPIQHFQTQVSTLSANLVGDPDFAALTLTAGAAEGLASPGMTTLEEIPGGGFVIDSFFDMSYRIEFVGAPGGVLEGLSGTTYGTVGIIAGIPDIFDDGFESGMTSAWSSVVP